MFFCWSTHCVFTSSCLFVTIFCPVRACPFTAAHLPFLRQGELFRPRRRIIWASTTNYFGRDDELVIRPVAKSARRISATNQRDESVRRIGGRAQLYVFYSILGHPKHFCRIRRDGSYDQFVVVFAGNDENDDELFGPRRRIVWASTTNYLGLDDELFWP